MPTARYEAKWFEPAPGDVIPATAVSKGIVDGQEVRIKVVGADGTSYHRSGTVLSSAEFVTPAIPMAGLQEVFGLQVSAYYQGSPKVDASASVGLQVTIDGTNYLSFSGGNWVAAALGGTYNTIGEFNDNCGTLSLANPRFLGFRVKLSPSGGVTPVLTLINARVEWDSNPHFDLHETLKDILETRLNIPVLRRIVLSQAADRFGIDSRYTPVAALANTKFSVYNLSTDANKNTNLFSQYDSANNLMVLTGQQDAGSALEYMFEGRCDVEVVRPDEQVEISEIPTTLVTIDDVSAVEGGSTGRIVEYKLGDNTKKARTRFHPSYLSCSVIVQHWARSPREALRAINRIEKVFTLGVVLLSTGEKLSLVVESEATFNDLTNQSYFSGSYRVRIFFYEHVEEYVEHDVVTQIGVNVGNLTHDWTSDGVLVGG